MTDETRSPLLAGSGARPLAATSATGEVIDLVADIEMQRQAMQQKAGLAASCSSALRKLHGLLDREQEASQPHGPVAGHRGNVEALKMEIERVKELADVSSRGFTRKTAYGGPRKATWQDARRNPARNKGRRTMGRAGGR
jgi:hypothetical protein